MTTTKLAYLTAMIVPGGFIILAALCAAHVYISRRRAVPALSSLARRPFRK